jgi:hypothetical protein
MAKYPTSRLESQGMSLTRPRAGTTAPPPPLTSDYLPPSADADALQDSGKAPVAVRARRRSASLTRVRPSLAPCHRSNRKSVVPPAPRCRATSSTEFSYQRTEDPSLDTQARTSI